MKSEKFCPRVGCGSKKIKPILVWKDMVEKFEIIDSEGKRLQPFDVWKCDKCGNEFLKKAQP